MIDDKWEHWFWLYLIKYHSVVIEKMRLLLPVAPSLQMLL